MNSMARAQKLKELRARTDQELVSVIESELSLHFAHLTQEKKSEGDSDRARVRAENALGDTLKLLSKVEDGSERERLQRKLAQLRKALDRESAPDESHVQAAYS